jgi:hypothetical protein
MPAVQIDLDDLLPRASLELHAEAIEHLPAEEVATLLVARYRAFLDGGCDCQLALWLAVRPGDPVASPWTSVTRGSTRELTLQ